MRLLHTAAPTQVDQPVKRAKRGTPADFDAVRFDATREHKRTERKSRGDCAYCGAARVCKFNCSDCGVSLHYPNAFDYPCAERFHSANPKYRRFCLYDHKTKRRPLENFEVDPDVAKIRTEAKRRQQPAAAGRRTFTVTQDPNPEPSKARTRSALITVTAVLPDSGAASVPN